MSVEHDGRERLTAVERAVPQLSHLAASERRIRHTLDQRDRRRDAWAGDHHTPVHELAAQQQVEPALIDPVLMPATVARIVRIETPPRGLTSTVPMLEHDTAIE